MASQQLRLMSDAGVGAGMTCGVVSSGYWATSEAAARARYAAFPAVDAWDISVDVFHAEFVPVSRVRTAYEVGYALGRQITLRVTHSTPLDDADQRILDALEEFARPADVIFRTDPAHRPRAISSPFFHRTPHLLDAPVHYAGHLGRP